MSKSVQKKTSFRLPYRDRFESVHLSITDDETTHRPLVKFVPNSRATSEFANPIEIQNIYYSYFSTSPRGIFVHQRGVSGGELL